MLVERKVQLSSLEEIKDFIVMAENTGAISR